MRSFCFIVHSFDHAFAALSVCKELNLQAVLVTAPQTVAFAGVQAAFSMLEQARNETQNENCRFILDCGENRGAVLAALRKKNVNVYTALTGGVYNALNEIAAQTGARLTNVLPSIRLDLSKHARLKPACRDFIKQQRKSHETGDLLDN